MVRFIVSGSLLLALAGFVAGQPSTAFEVASIKLNPAGINGGRVQFPPGGKFSGDNVPLDFLIQQAYDIHDYQLIGPSWLAVNRFVIQAEAADHAADTPALKVMLQNLLAERFHLKLHRETRELPVFELVVDKGGLKIQPLSAVETEKYGDRRGFGWNRDGIIANNATFAIMAQALTREVGRPILDKTGVSNKFDFKVKYGQSLSRADGGDGPAAGGDSIFSAIREQLGLRLDSRKAPVEVLVVDSCDKTATEN